MYHIHTLLLKGAQLAIRLSHDTAAVIYVTAVEETWPTKTPPCFLLAPRGGRSYARRVQLFARRPSVGSITVGLRV